MRRSCAGLVRGVLRCGRAAPSTTATAAGLCAGRGAAGHQGAAGALIQNMADSRGFAIGALSGPRTLRLEVAGILVKFLINKFSQITLILLIVERGSFIHSFIESQLPAARHG